MFQLIKKVFFIGLTILSNFMNTSSPLSCISMKNQEFKAGPQVINVNGHKPVFLPFSIETSKRSVVVIILTIRLHKFVFLILQKI